MKSNYKTTSTAPCKSRDESNETFDRVIRGWLLQYHCSKSSINYRHQISLEKLHSSLKRFCKQTSFSALCMRDSLLGKRARKKPLVTKHGPTPRVLRDKVLYVAFLLVFFRKGNDCCYPSMQQLTFFKKKGAKQPLCSFNFAPKIKLVPLLSKKSI